MVVEEGGGGTSKFLNSDANRNNELVTLVIVRAQKGGVGGLGRPGVPHPEHQYINCNYVFNYCFSGVGG